MHRGWTCLKERQHAEGGHAVRGRGWEKACNWGEGGEPEGKKEPRSLISSETIGGKDEWRERDELRVAQACKLCCCSQALWHIPVYFVLHWVPASSLQILINLAALNIYASVLVQRCLILPMYTSLQTTLNLTISFPHSVHTKIITPSNHHL